MIGIAIFVFFVVVVVVVVVLLLLLIGVRVGHHLAVSDRQRPSSSGIITIATSGGQPIQVGGRPIDRLGLLFLFLFLVISSKCR
jgi:hypothetical protein